MVSSRNKDAVAVSFDVDEQIIDIDKKNIKKSLKESSRKLKLYEIEKEKFENTFILLKPFKKGNLNSAMGDAVAAIGVMSKVTLLTQGQTIKNQEILKEQNDVLYETQLRIDEQSKANEKNTLELKELVVEFLKLKDLTVKDIQDITNTINNYQEKTNELIDEKLNDFEGRLSVEKKAISSLKSQNKYILRIMYLIILINIALATFFAIDTYFS